MTDGNETLHFIRCANYHGLRLWTKYFVSADEVDAFLINIFKTMTNFAVSTRNSYEACTVKVHSDGKIRDSEIVVRFTIK